MQLDGEQTKVLIDRSRGLYEAWSITSAPMAYHVLPDGLVVAGNHPGKLRDILDLRRRVDAFQESASSKSHPQ
ncbi:MAG: hypothetical protein JWO76_2757 [Nocardioides sp.]|nr:hypothetical protein [Nocardioides sp.]